MSMFFFFKQKTAYEMRISDWSSDVCSSDLFSRQTRKAPIRLLENYSYQPLLIAALADDNAGQHGGSPPPALLVRLNRLALKQRNFVFERLLDMQRLQPIFCHPIKIERPELFLNRRIRQKSLTKIHLKI